MDDEQPLRNRDEQEMLETPETPETPEMPQLPEMPDRTSAGETVIRTPDDDDPSSDPGALENYRRSIDDIAARLLAWIGC